MKIVVIDDYQNAFKTLKSYPKLSGHEVVVYTDTEKDAAKLAERLKDAEVVVLTQQRSAFPRAVIERLPKLKLIGQTGRAATHVDLEACTEKGIIVSAGGSGNSNATAELTWGLILSALRNLPYEVKRLKEGQWQSTLGIGSQRKNARHLRLRKNRQYRRRRRQSVRRTSRLLGSRRLDRPRQSRRL